MKSKKTKIPQFYDVFDEEIGIIRRNYEYLLEEAKQMGFMEIETSSIELRERYINATGVHFSKIFEVRRPKQGNQFALQADLAMSMSRFVADLPTVVPALKLIQLGKMYRDRINTLPGYRREFKQILLGEWGVESLYSDAEIIFLTYKMLKNIPNSKISYIEISNANVFNSISEGLAERIRFNGIEVLNNEKISEQDKEIIKKEFTKEQISFSELELLENKLHNMKVREELQKAKEIKIFLTDFFKVSDEIFFSLKNLEGTGHYSGLHYRIYLDIAGDNYLIGDGGRIDTLCNKFNSSKNIPAVCMGIGVQVLAQLISDIPKKKITILVDSKLIKEKWSIIDRIREELIDYSISVIPKSPSNKKKFFKSEFYQDNTFILLEEDSFEVRSNDKEVKEYIVYKIKDIVSKS